MIITPILHPSPILFPSSPWSWCPVSSLSPPTPRRFPPVQASAMTSRLTRGCLTTTTGPWRTQRRGLTMARRRTVMEAWWLGSTGSSSLMAEHRLSGIRRHFYRTSISKELSTISGTELTMRLATQQRSPMRGRPGHMLRLPSQLTLQLSYKVMSWSCFSANFKPLLHPAIFKVK